MLYFSFAATACVTMECLAAIAPVPLAISAPAIASSTPVTPTPYTPPPRGIPGRREGGGTR